MTQSRSSMPLGAGLAGLVALLALVGLIVGCAPGGPSPPSPPSAAGAQHASAAPRLPADCTRTIRTATDLAAVLDAVSAGTIVCFTGTGLADTEVTLSRSGTAQAPITLIADGATVRSVQVRADHVIVDGFTVTAGDGMLLQGTGLTARNNLVHDTQRGGITCECTDSTIEANTMRHVATNGVDVTGSRITVHANTISGTVPRDGGDADGMRFYGHGLRITDNSVSDISASGYANPPHPDCFQTLDNSKPPTYDVVISANTCRNVDAQCLIATGDQDANSGAPAGLRSITFIDNTCATNGAQAVNLRRWPNVAVLNNHFSGPNLDRGVSIIEGSTGVTVTGNTTARGLPTIDIDDSSQTGFHQDNNS